MLGGGGPAGHRRDRATSSQLSEPRRRTCPDTRAWDRAARSRRGRLVLSVNRNHTLRPALNTGRRPAVSERYGKVSGPLSVTTAITRPSTQARGRPVKMIRMVCEPVAARAGLAKNPRLRHSAAPATPILLIMAKCYRGGLGRRRLKVVRWQIGTGVGRL